jgi:putative sugar O-methyltransferase
MRRGHPTDAPEPPDDEALLARIQDDLQALLNGQLTSESDTGLVPRWAARTTEALQLLASRDGRLNVSALRNFRSDLILVDDIPYCDLGRNYWKNNPATNFVVGWRRGTRACLLECLRILKQRGFAPLLRQYPCLPVGNPHAFDHQGYRYTFRWARHVYFLGLLKQVLHDRLRRDFVFLDIGGSYGSFSNLVKREYPASHHILVDLPEQLILARYFLGSCLPQARIAGVTELLRESAITRDFVVDHDFLLVPTSLFGRLSPNCADVVGNFASFSEMKREYFDRYTRSDVFRTARYFYTINRIEPFPKAFGTDISILDFPITDANKRLHFGICPIFSVPFEFTHRLLFLTSYRDPPPFFEYIGEL